MSFGEIATRLGRDYAGRRYCLAGNYPIRFVLVVVLVLNFPFGFEGEEDDEYEDESNIMCFWPDASCALVRAARRGSNEA